MTDAIKKDLKYGRNLLGEFGFSGLSGTEREKMDGIGNEDLSTACECYLIFRRLHALSDSSPAYATLLGDYFFSMFSRCLADLDDKGIIEAFGERLAAESEFLICGGEAPGDYFDFISELCRGSLCC